MLAEIPWEQVYRAIDAQVGRLLRRAGVFQPAVDAFRVAQALGLTVLRNDRQAERARYVRSGFNSPGERSGRDDMLREASIFIRRDPRPEREQWAVAHEIGEHLSVELFASLGVDPAEAPPTAREQLANRLASRLLLPAEWFGDLGRACDWDLPALKQQFHTASHELLARRMLDFDAPAIVTVVDQRAISWRRSNLAGRPPQLADWERSTWLRSNESGQPGESHHQGARMRVWPVHEPEWKREIIRTDLPEQDEWGGDESDAW
ncbi:MAG: ImmA/IrrE family metallo-endopeptidase [Planctomycetes bacterium]|nr:ImmA/IrrE family metallo-endopeptidase [Planctomycetota bacterium]